MSETTADASTGDEQSNIWSGSSGSDEKNGLEVAKNSLKTK